MVQREMLERVPATARKTILGDDSEDGSLLVVAIAGLTLVATILTFLFTPAYALPMLAVFVAVTAVGWVTYQAEIARLLTLVATVSTVLTVGFITAFLFSSAFPAFVEHGLGLLIIPEGQWFFGLDAVLPVDESYWNPSNDVYSLLPMMWATVIVTVIAIAVAGPLGLFGALFISEVASDRMREFIKPGVEILAGIPSIVYGFIGFQVLNGFIQTSFLDEERASLSPVSSSASWRCRRSSPSARTRCRASRRR
ncbi:hypothetical protein VB773_10020 [Haloarculaceae archaeon H-GB2-1]|nr:hypothetical protein [Haloarculaceae archaeon H-GB2-1]